MSESREVTDVPAVPPRPVEAHKGTFGTVVVVGGSDAMIGAPALAATAALRTGCGLVRIMTRPGILPHCLTIEPSATGLPLPYIDDPKAVADTVAKLRPGTVLAVGPGMSTSPAAERGIEMLLGGDFATVLDADGLNNLANLGPKAAVVRCPLVMTPHPGEYRRLAKAAGIDLDPTDPEQRVEAAGALARRYGAVVALKGHRTVVSDGGRHYINTTGNPALATAGTGDILTGAIASLMAQGMERFEAAALGVHLHGLAADLWAARHSPAGMTARDLANWLPHAIAERARS